MSKTTGQKMIDAHEMIGANEMIDVNEMSVLIVVYKK